MNAFEQVKVDASGTYANYSEARRAFYEDTLIPWVIEKEPTSRRLAIVDVEDGLFVQWFSVGTPAAKVVSGGLPDDAKLVRGFHVTGLTRSWFRLLFESPSFAEVAPNDRPPILTPLFSRSS